MLWFSGKATVRRRASYAQTARSQLSPVSLTSSIVHLLVSLALAAVSFQRSPGLYHVVFSGDSTLPLSYLRTADVHAAVLLLAGTSFTYFDLPADTRLPDSAYLRSMSAEMPHAKGAEGTVRFDLFECQRAEKARKSGTVDRRSLDPPPVVTLRIFDNTGTPGGKYALTVPDEMSTLGLVCSVNLLPLAPSKEPRLNPRIVHISNDALDARKNPNTPTQHTTYNTTNKTYREYAEVGSPQTYLLSGRTTVEPTVVNWSGEKQTMFVFGDLAIQSEGVFLLHFRVFNVTLVAETGNSSAIAECYGSPFKVYSTKDFPGLGPSTDLTKHLSLLGVPVNTRFSEGRGKKH